MTMNFRVEIGRVGEQTTDRTRFIKQRAEIILRPGACVLYAPEGMPEATTVVAEMTGVEVEDGIIWASGYGMPGVVEALEAKNLFIAFAADTKHDTPVCAATPLMISKLIIQGGTIITPDRYSWRD